MRNKKRKLLEIRSRNMKRNFTIPENVQKTLDENKNYPRYFIYIPKANNEK